MKLVRRTRDWSAANRQPSPGPIVAETIRELERRISRRRGISFFFRHLAQRHVRCEPLKRIPSPSTFMPRQTRPPHHHTRHRKGDPLHRPSAWTQANEMSRTVSGTVTGVSDTPAPIRLLGGLHYASPSYVCRIQISLGGAIFRGARREAPRALWHLGTSRSRSHDFGVTERRRRSCRATRCPAQARSLQRRHWSSSGTRRPRTCSDPDRP